MKFKSDFFTSSRTSNTFTCFDCNSSVFAAQEILRRTVWIQYCQMNCLYTSGKSWSVWFFPQCVFGYPCCSKLEFSNELCFSASLLFIWKQFPTRAEVRMVFVLVELLFSKWRIVGKRYVEVILVYSLCLQLFSQLLNCCYVFISRKGWCHQTVSLYIISWVC